MIVSGSRDKTVKVWNWRSGECLKTLTFRESNYSVAICPKRDVIVIRSGDDVIIWNMKTMKQEAAGVLPKLLLINEISSRAGIPSQEIIDYIGKEINKYPRSWIFTNTNC